MLPAERRRFLATVGRRLTAQALQRRDAERRNPILLTLLAQSATEVLDEVVQLFDQAVSSRESKAAHRMRDELAERGKAGEDRQALLDAILAIVARGGGGLPARGAAADPACRGPGTIGPRFSGSA